MFKQGLIVEVVGNGLRDESDIDPNDVEIVEALKVELSVEVVGNGLRGASAIDSSEVET
jgi:hypothetical protein